MRYGWCGWPMFELCVYVLWCSMLHISCVWCVDECGIVLMYMKWVLFCVGVQLYNGVLHWSGWPTVERRAHVCRWVLSGISEVYEWVYVCVRV